VVPRTKEIHDVPDRQARRNGFGATLAEVWDGTAWHLQQTAGPSNTEIVGLEGISCLPGGACTAVGSFGPSQPGFGAFVPLAEQRS
jgi:hypothetical protein